MKFESLNDDNATIEHAIIYLRELFEHHDESNTDIAYKMAAVVSCKDFEKWREDEDFDDLFSIIGGLELSDNNKEKRRQQWNNVGQLIAKLTHHYSV
jgi:hypothetical protein